MSDRRHNYSETVPKILLNPSPLLRTDQTGKQDKFAITSGRHPFFFFFKMIFCNMRCKSPIGIIQAHLPNKLQ